MMTSKNVLDILRKLYLQNSKFAILQRCKGKLNWPFWSLVHYYSKYKMSKLFTHRFLFQKLYISPFSHRHKSRFFFNKNTHYNLQSVLRVEIPCVYTIILYWEIRIHSYFIAQGPYIQFKQLTCKYKIQVFYLNHSLTAMHLVCVCVHACMCVCVCVCVHACMCVCACVCVCVCVLNWVLFLWGCVIRMHTCVLCKWVSVGRVLWHRGVWMGLSFIAIKLHIIALFHSYSCPSYIVAFLSALNLLVQYAILHLWLSLNVLYVLC